jgi:hypothetical protein
MSKMPAWEVVLRVINPEGKNAGRPRRTSMHTLAYVTGCKTQDEALALAKEMKDSKKVVGYHCPDVQTPIFYLDALRKLPGMIDTRDPKVWDTLSDFFKLNPFPQVKGFKRFAQGTWSGGEYGKGTYTPGEYAMGVAYEPADYPYAKLIIDQLKANGYTPGLTEEDLK